MRTLFYQYGTDVAYITNIFATCSYKYVGAVDGVVNDAVATTSAPTPVTDDKKQMWVVSFRFSVRSRCSHPSEELDEDSEALPHVTITQCAQ